MNIAQIEENLQNLILNYTQETFIYELLLAYGLPKASITRLQKGNLNLSKVEGEISWKKKLFFKPVFNQDLHLAISEIKNTLKQDQRFVIVTDFEKLLAIDTKTADSLDIDFTTLPKHFDFFLPWAGMEKATHQNENPADVKAAEKMARLFDEIKKDNPDNSPEFIHGLNVFLSRLLFCFFAEDTGIFELGQFTNALASHTQTDGSDLTDYLDKLFDILNTPRIGGTDAIHNVSTAAYLLDFPYVNGGLFKEQQPTPLFTRRSRQAIIDAGQMDWAAINPDIFGSMFQAVISVDQRGSLGQHYTSVPNIMKVIEPLFLNDLYAEFENAKGNKNKLEAALKRIWNIKLFDPACGSGNFLIIAYKELRKLEMGIFKEIDTANKTYTTQYSGISLNHFYGIEIDDFAHEIAILSLWLAEHQMNQEFFKAFGRSKPALPLEQTGSIVHGNATRVDWEMVCPKNEGDEIYILGNPPYLGARLQSEDQKSDMAFVFDGIKGYNNLDYISCWFLKGAFYIKGYNSKIALVSTNSICQGEQVSLLWPTIFSNKIEIDFAYKSFKWENNAKNQAAVICSIISLRNQNNQKKYLFEHSTKKEVLNINAYLIGNSQNIYIFKRSNPISILPSIVFGSMPNDRGHLIFDEKDKDNLLLNFPHAVKFIKKLIGAEEFTNSTCRWCLWINKDDVEEAIKIPFIKDRIEQVRLARLNSSRAATRKLSNNAHAFGEIRHQDTNSIIIPSTTSSRRVYVPIGFLGSDTIISNRAHVIYGSNVFVFGVVSSKIHMNWLASIAGRLKNDYLYSALICYNTFPFPPISQSQKEELEQCVFRILEERENHSEKTLAQMYDPDKMPEGLREAHRLNDLAVERCYRSKPFESDEERLEYLFKLYEKMIAEEKKKDTLFAAEKKAKKIKM